MQEPVAPAPGHPERAGRWVAEPPWPPAEPAARRLDLDVDGLVEELGAATAVREVDSDECQGRDAGNWIGWGRDTDWPTDQRFEDALSMTFDSAVLDANLEVLGFVDAHLQIAADRPSAFVGVRFCEVDPEGRSTLITCGVLNLTHRGSHEHSEPMEPGRFEDVNVRLKVIGHRFGAGNRLRVAITPGYWPLVWPSPTPVRLSVETGAARWIIIPERTPRPEDDTLAPFEPACVGACTPVHAPATPAIHAHWD